MVINVSTLTAYNLCPKAFHEDKSFPEITNTYKGDILNAAVLNAKYKRGGDRLQSGVGFLVKQYGEFIDPSMKGLKKMGDILTEAVNYMEWVRTVTKGEYFQEVKFIYPYDKDTWIVGTPDIFFKEEGTNTWIIEDFKYSTVNRYGNEDVLKYDCQSRIYPFFVMNAMGTEKATFRFQVFDKNSGKRVQTGEHTITKTQAKKFMDDVVGRFLMSHELDDWPANKNPKCMFCPLKKVCPVWN